VLLSITMTIHFDPPFGPVQTAALLLLTVGAALALYLGREMRRSKRHPLLIVLRSGVILLLALLLINPVATLTAPQAKRKAPFLLLLDTSRSMTTRDVPTVSAPETRWQAARQATLDNHVLLEALAQRYQVRVYGFDARAAAGGNPVDLAFALDAVRTYARQTRLDAVTATVVELNFADDILYPPAEAPPLPPRFTRISVPASAATRGHATLGMPSIWLPFVAPALAAARR